jgi:hypothetical protein
MVLLDKSYLNTLKMKKIMIWILLFMMIQSSIKSSAQKEQKSLDNIAMVGKINFKNNKKTEQIKFSLIEKPGGSYVFILISKNEKDSLLHNGNIIKNIFKKEVDSKSKDRFLINENNENCFLIYFSDHELGYVNRIKLFSIIIKTMNKIEKEINCSVKIEQYNIKS